MGVCLQSDAIDFYTNSLNNINEINRNSQVNKSNIECCGRKTA